MTSVLEEVPTSTNDPPAERLRASMAAMRLSFSWFGIRKSLTAEQRAEAAGAFGAETEVLSAGKRLINTRHPKYKAVSSIRTRAGALWKGLSLPFPEPGIRLVKHDEIDSINRHLASLKDELELAVQELDDHFKLTHFVTLRIDPLGLGSRCVVGCLCLPSIVQAERAAFLRFSLRR